MSSVIAAPTINVKAVLSHFGGVAALVEQAQAAGLPLTAKAVEKWRERASIPMDRWLELRELASRAGRALTLDTFLSYGADTR